MVVSVRWLSSASGRWRDMNDCLSFEEFSSGDRGTIAKKERARNQLKDLAFGLEGLLC